MWRNPSCDAETPHLQLPRPWVRISLLFFTLRCWLVSLFICAHTAQLSISDLQFSLVGRARWCLQCAHGFLNPNPMYFLSYIHFVPNNFVNVFVESILIEVYFKQTIYYFVFLCVSGFEAVHIFNYFFESNPGFDFIKDDIRCFCFCFYFFLRFAFIFFDLGFYKSWSAMFVLTILSASKFSLSNPFSSICLLLMSGRAVMGYDYKILYKR